MWNVDIANVNAGGTHSDHWASKSPVCKNEGRSGQHMSRSCSGRSQNQSGITCPCTNTGRKTKFTLKMHPAQNLWYHDVTSASSNNTMAPRTRDVIPNPRPYINSNLKVATYVHQMLLYRVPMVHPALRIDHAVLWAVTSKGTTHTKSSYFHTGL